MRKVFLKDGVGLAGLQPEMLWGIDRIERENISLVITSARDGVHSKHSHHYKGLAIDLRVWDIDDTAAMCRKIRGMLGSEYQVIDESNHIHIEYDPEHV